MDLQTKIVSGVLGSLLVVSLVTIGLKATSDFQQGQMPRCDSKPIRSLLKRSIEESPGARQASLRLDLIGTLEDYAGAPTPGSLAADPAQDLRFCKAVIYTSAGQGEIHFTLKWIDTAKTQIWLQVTLSTI